MISNKIVFNAIITIYYNKKPVNKLLLKTV